MGGGKKLVAFTKQISRRVLPSRYTLHEPRCFNVPKNESEVLNLSPNAVTPEGKLKSVLLSNAEGSRVCTIVGMGGVGKTTGMCALSRDPQVCIRYHDGIWFIQLGQGATMEDLRADLSRLVSDACSAEFTIRFSELLGQKGGDMVAAGALVRELEKMRFLLIFDDVWDEDDVYAIIKKIVDTASGSSGHLMVLISTREKRVAYRPFTNSVVNFEPKEPQGLISRRILCVHAGVKLESLPDPSTDVGKAVTDILEKCGGLPLAIVVAGSSVQSIMRDTHNEVDRAYCWTKFRDTMDACALKLGRDGSNQHEAGFFFSIAASVSFLELKWPKDATARPREVLSSLCIFPKQTQIPLDTLDRAWRTKPGEAESFLELLSDYSIVSRSLENKKLHLRAHDLVLDYCMQLADGGGMVCIWHERLIQGYACHLDHVQDEEIKCMNWWSEKLSTDSYIRPNVVRHLIGCGRIDEALRLVCDYRWVQLLNADNSNLPFQQCISDLKRLESVLSSDTEVDSELGRDVKPLYEAMESSVRVACARNRTECSFQMYGRLSSYMSRSELFNRYLWSIETYSTTHWLKPAPGVLNITSTGLKDILSIPFRAKSMQLGLEMDELVLGGLHGEIALMDLRRGLLRWETKGHEYTVSDFGIDKRTEQVFSSSWDGSVAVWRGGAEVRRLQPFQSEKNEVVTSMKLLQPLKLVACGSSFGRLSLMDLETGRTVGKMNSHSGMVTSIEVCKCGELLISASADATIRMWGTRCGEPMGKPLRGHRKGINVLSLSADERLIASGSDDKTVRLWNVHEGVEVCTALTGHNGFVYSVLFSQEGGELFSSSEDEILIWDVRDPHTCVYMKHRLSYGMGYVTSLCLSRDGGELFAASSNRSQIFIWRRKAEKSENHRYIREHRKSFMSDIESFRISQDGETMATWSRNSDNKICFRRIPDVAKGINNVLATCPVSAVKWVAQIGLSNNMQFVAYCEGYVWKDATVYVVQATTGEVVHELKALSQWAQALHDRDDVDYYDEHISDISFSPDDMEITATARIRRSSDNKWLAKSMTWIVPTGKSSIGENMLSFSSTSMLRQARKASRASVTFPCLSVKDACVGENPITTQIRIFDSQEKNLTGGTLDVAPACSQYVDSAKRLWFSHCTTGLQFVDLMSRPVIDPTATPPPMSLVRKSFPRQAPDVHVASKTKQSTKYTVFISYSGLDKPVADWLYARLTEMGISVFMAKMELKVGENASKAMIEAMEHADVAIVIISPEYPAKKWTMRELLCFQRRAREAEECGHVGPIIIPVFFRMDAGICKSSKILDLKTEDGQDYVFHRYKFFDRLDELKLDIMLDSMRCLGGLQGIENPKRISYRPRTGQSEEEWQEELHEVLEKVIVEVRRVVQMFGKQVVQLETVGSKVSDAG